MKEGFETPDYAQLQEQIEMLRKEMEELKADRSRTTSINLGGLWRRFARRHSWAWLRITVAVLLVLGLLGAQSKQDALYIDQKGNVGINQTKPEAVLDVNGNALIRNDVTIQGQVTGKTLDVAGNAGFRGLLQAKAAIPGGQTLPANSGLVMGESDIYFTNTAHAHSGQGNQQGFAAIENEGKNFNALMLLGRQTNAGRIVGMWDRVGIGRGDPKVPLDVIGEIRGKPWVSNEYEWSQGEGDSNNTKDFSVQMTRVDRSVCFLTGIRGKFQGREERVDIVQIGNYWHLQGRSQQIHIRVRARCIGAPDDSWK